ncbi:type VI secretion system Vgr family protein [Achromobacter sp. NPDC008082]|uniref:type VI secretion system Vgr family protein n=1 Tax=Achromobacter sp. NPDC008082 TaxID=3363888 RepID=UPI0036E52185
MTGQRDLRFSFNIVGGMAFELVEFTLDEGLSEPFVLNLELASDDSSIDFGLVLDQPALLTLWHGDTAVRYVHGVVSRFEQGTTGFRRTRYRATVEPMLARAGLCSDWRIFQQLSVPEILQTVLKTHGIIDYEQTITNEHLPREYCVQAGDTDLHFLERLAREEGFFYVFHHHAKGHRLVHSDRLQIHGRIDGEPVRYVAAPGGTQPEPALRRFSYAEQVRTARQTHRDYTYTHPRYSQEHSLDGVNLDHQSRRYERYDYPGRYKRDEAGKPFTENRLRGLRRDARIAQVEGDDPRLVPGLSFELVGHPRADLNQGWRPIRMRHHGVQHTSQQEDGADAQQGTRYSYTAELVSKHAEWRAEPLAKPRIDGPQIAVVTGPAGEEIYCDSYGRVKVQFPWDRLGNHDEHSSCWIRVSQNWAGATWGHMAIPRVGQEVIVHYLDGDADQPVITGRTHMALQLPPYELPRHKTRMTIKSQTHKGLGYNELRFEDERDQEEIYIHAQKDQNIHVNHDESTFVGHDRNEKVENDETILVGHNRDETVGLDEQVDIGQDRRHRIGQDDLLEIVRDHTILTGHDRTEEVGNNRRDKTHANHWINTGGHVEHQVQGHHRIEAGQAIERKTTTYRLQTRERIVLQSPGGSITLDDGGITLEGVSINLKGPLSQQGGGAGIPLHIDGAPNLDEPICLSCWLKAAKERSALMKVSP